MFFLNTSWLGSKARKESSMFRNEQNPRGKMFSRSQLGAAAQEHPNQELDGRGWRR